MSEIKNRRKLNPKATLFKTILFSISWIPLFFITPLWLLCMGARLKPAKIKWILLGTLVLLVDIFIVIIACCESDLTPMLSFALLLSILLVIYVWVARVYEEYVMRYNAVVDSGYYVEKKKAKAASRQRWEEEVAQDAKKQAEELASETKDAPE